MVFWCNAFPKPAKSNILEGRNLLCPQHRQPLPPVSSRFGRLCRKLIELSGRTPDRWRNTINGLGISPDVDLHGDKRTFLGAVAGVVMTSNVKEYALGHGFYVIKPSGETFNITPPSGKPKEW